MLIGESLGFHTWKGYIYFAMAFSVAVELLNMQLRSGANLRWEEPVQLRKKLEEE